MATPRPTLSNFAPQWRAAFAELLDDIRAVPEDDFVPINLDVETAVKTALDALVRLRPLRDQIVKETPIFDITLIDRLEIYAYALGHAQTAYRTVNEPHPSLVALGARAVALRKKLLAEANALVQRGIIAPAALKPLKGINGYRHIGLDLVTLANILRNNWDEVARRTGIERKDIDEAQNVASELMAAVVARDQAPAITAEAVRDRQAAFTLFVHAYDEVRSVIGYIRRKQGDLESFAPSLYAGRARTKKKLAEVDVPATEPRR